MTFRVETEPPAPGKPMAMTFRRPQRRGDFPAIPSRPPCRKPLECLGFNPTAPGGWSEYPASRRQARNSAVSISKWIQPQLFFRPLNWALRHASFAGSGISGFQTPAPPMIGRSGELLKPFATHLPSPTFSNGKLPASTCADGSGRDRATLSAARGTL